MARSRKRTRLYLNNQISRSQALTYLAQNEINQATVPAAEVEDPQSEAEDVDQEQDEGDSILTFSLGRPTGTQIYKSQSLSSFHPKFLYLFSQYFLAVCTSGLEIPLTHSPVLT
jgi:hypothetical protein